MPKEKYLKILTKESLLIAYIKNKKSINQIAKETGIYWSTIKKYIFENKIKLRTHREQASISSKGPKPKYEKILTKSFLIENYSKNKKSIDKISKEIGIYRETVSKYLRKFEIPIRSATEQKRILYPSKEFELSKSCLGFLDGLLLGDGSIPRNQYNSRSYTQVCKHKEYLDYIEKRLKNFGIVISPIRGRWIKDYRCKNGGYKEYFLQTRRYGTFDILRKRWYRNGKKIIPRDIVITRDTILQFYLCDGNYYREVRLCVSGFNLNYVKFLKKLIEKNINVEPRLITSPSLNGNADLAIKKSDVGKFIKFIGESPVKCYKYKWKDN